MLKPFKKPAKILEQLEKALPKQPHYWDAGTFVDTQVWVEAGKPYSWDHIDQRLGRPRYDLLVDNAYGRLALFKNAELVMTGTDFVKSDDDKIIGVSEYFGVSTRLYKLAR